MEATEAGRRPVAAQFAEAAGRLLPAARYR